MKNHIEVTLKTHYGTEFIYPLCEQAKKFCKLLGGQKSLTAVDIEGIKALGFEVHQIVEMPNGKAVKVANL